LFAFCALATASLVSDVPLFAWAGKENAFGGINVGLSSALSTNDVEALVKSILHNTNVPNPFPHNASLQPEVLIVYLSSKLRLDQVSAFSAHLPALKNVMKNSVSSFFAPHLDIPDSLTATLIKATSFVSKKSASVVYVGKGATLLPELRQAVPHITVVSHQDAKNLLASSKIFSNGVTDLLIVHLDDVVELVDKFSKTNTIIQSMNEFISERTHNFVSIYTGLKYEQVGWEESFGQKRGIAELLQDYVMLDDPTNATNSTQPTVFQEFFPGWFWEVTFSFMFIIPIIIAGYCMLMGVQAPENFIPPHKDKFKKRS